MESANMAGRNVQTYTLENKNTLRKLATLRNEGQLCDLMFIFPDGSQIEAHKAIVCQYSSVIKARCVDIDQHKLQVLCTDIDNEQAINPSILNIMLDYIYGLSITIRHEYIQDIMRLAIKLNIPEFLGDCDKILFENKALGPSDLMINAQNIKQEQTGSGYETGQASDFGMADQPLVTPSTSFDDTNLQEPIDEKAAKPPGRRKRKATKVVKASVEQLPEPQSDEDDDMMDNPLDDDTDEYEADNFTAIKAEEADSDYNESASPKKRKRSKAKKTTVSTKRSHQKKTATLDPLFCKECDQKFDAYKDAAEHHKGVHNLIVCDVCAKIFDNEADLRRHSVLHSERIQIVDEKTGELVYICDTCEYKTERRNHLYKHLRCHHGTKIFRCKQCPRCMKDYNHYEEHVLTKHITTPCEICGKLFGDRYMPKHRLKHLKGDLTCHECGMLLKGKKAMSRHMRAHGMPEEYPCSICGKLFSSRHGMLHHEKTHVGIQLFRCRHCGNRFTTKHRLNIHYRENDVCARHTKISVLHFICDVCGRKMSGKRELIGHRIRVHGVGITDDFPCKLCDKVYKVKGDLLAHLREFHYKKYNCNVCGKMFGTARYLEVHMITHTGEKPFTCTSCGRKFARKDSTWYKHKKICYNVAVVPSAPESNTALESNLLKSEGAI